MFLFFSNKLGCFGSLLISGILTIIVLSLFGLIIGQRLVIRTAELPPICSLIVL